MNHQEDQLGQARPLTAIDDKLAWGLESSPDGMVLTDDQGVMLMVNSRIEVLFGFDRAELLGREVEYLLAEHLRQAHIAHRLRYRADPRPRPMGGDLELWGCRNDGEEFPVEVSLSPLDIDEQTWLLATIRDVSERRSVEAHAKLVQHTIDAAHDGVFIFSPETLEFTYVNQGASDQLGYSQRELLTMTPLDVKPEFTESAFRELLEPLLTGDVPSRTYTTVYRRRSGVDMPVEILLESPEPAASDEPRLVIAIVRDITERRRAEAERDRHQAWLEALSEVRTWLLEQGSTEEALQLVCRHACELVDATDAVILSLVPRASMATVAASFGHHGDDLRLIELPLHDTALGRALTGSESLQFAAAADLGAEVAQAFTPLGIGPLIGATMQGSQGDVIGVLLTGRSESASLFEQGDLDIVKSFAHEASTAIGTAQARANDAQLSLFEDRERIAHDLHDMVIQRLFATGMSIQSLHPLVEDPLVRDRLVEAVVELDRTISEIRSTIFRLSRPPTSSVGTHIQSVVEGATQSLGFEPSLVFVGEIELMPEGLLHELTSALTEALSNVARHAEATAVTITVDVDGDEVRLVVTDNGVGIGGGITRGSGLDNLASRARHLNGSFTFEASARGGTTLSWVARGLHPKGPENDPAEA